MWWTRLWRWRNEGRQGGVESGVEGRQGGVEGGVPGVPCGMCTTVASVACEGVMVESRSVLLQRQENAGKVVYDANDAPHTPQKKKAGKGLTGRRGHGLNLQGRAVPALTTHPNGQRAGQAALPVVAVAGCSDGRLPKLPRLPRMWLGTTASGNAAGFDGVESKWDGPADGGLHRGRGGVTRSGAGTSAAAGSRSHGHADVVGV